MSSCFSFFIYKIAPIDLFIEGFKNTPYVIFFYAILIYLLQLPSCMKIWKPMLKEVLERKFK